MKYLHYSIKPIKKLYDISQIIEYKRYKPFGLWLSHNKKWKIWSKHNMLINYNSDNDSFDASDSDLSVEDDETGGSVVGAPDERGKGVCSEPTQHKKNRFIYKIILKKNANLYCIKNLNDLLLFEKKYKSWHDVAKDWHGINVYNFQNIKREMLNQNHYIVWFIALDISCACVWNMSAIESYLEINSISKI